MIGKLPSKKIVVCFFCKNACLNDLLVLGYSRPQPRSWY